MKRTLATLAILAGCGQAPATDEPAIRPADLKPGTYHATLVTVEDTCDIGAQGEINTFDMVYSAGLLDGARCVEDGDGLRCDGSEMFPGDQCDILVNKTYTVDQWHGGEYQGVWLYRFTMLNCLAAGTSCRLAGDLTLLEMD